MKSAGQRSFVKLFFFVTKKIMNKKVKMQEDYVWNISQPPVSVCSSCLSPLYQNQYHFFLLSFLFQGEKLKTLVSINQTENKDNVNYHLSYFLYWNWDYTTFDICPKFRDHQNYPPKISKSKIFLALPSRFFSKFFFLKIYPHLLVEKEDRKL